MPKYKVRVENSENECRNKNQHSRETLCAIFWGKRTTLNFLVQICPKVDLGMEIQKTNFGIKISIFETRCVPILRQSEHFLLFRPKFAPKNYFVVRI